MNYECEVVPAQCFIFIESVNLQKFSRLNIDVLKKW